MPSKKELRTAHRGRTKLVARGLERLRRAKLMELDGLTDLIAAAFRTDGEGDISHHSGSRERYYISVRELARRIPYSEKTIRNLMSTGELVVGLHYFKRSGRVMFSWSAMHEWIERQQPPAPISGGIPLVRNRKGGRQS